MMVMLGGLEGVDFVGGVIISGVEWGDLSVCKVAHFLKNYTV